MGYMRHDAIVVTGCDFKGTKHGNDLHAAWEYAKSIGLTVTEMSTEVTNGYRSFLISPDGSKEGWLESNLGDKQRSEWIKRVTYGELYIEWVHVAFGGDFRDDNGDCVIEGNRESTEV